MSFLICGPDEVVNVGHHGTITLLLSGAINIMDFISFSQYALIILWHIIKAQVYIFMHDSIRY